MARFPSMEMQAEYERLGRHAGRWLVSFLKARGPPASNCGDASVDSGLFLLYTVRTAHRSTATARCTPRDTLVAFPFQGLGSLLLPVYGNSKGLLGKSPFFLLF